MSFKILSSGIFSTIQDQGRYGFNHLGITHSGAIDEYAYGWSQKLLGQKNINAIELMVGLKLEVLKEIEISVTGADLGFKINQKLSPIWQSYSIRKGDVLTFSKRVSGQRAYLAVKNGFICEQKYGSCATTLKENIGFKIKRGDILETYSDFKRSTIFRLKKELIPNYEKPLTLRLLLSYQDDYFLTEEKEKFFNSEYQVTLESDRMGFKLKGQAIFPKKGGIISEGIAFGSVQIPKNGQPIVLLKERQTIGGYPKIGTVLAVDCFSLAQISIGSMVRFKAIEIEEAQEIMRDYLALFT